MATATSGVRHLARSVARGAVGADRALLVALGVLVAFAVLAFTAPLWYPTSPLATDPAHVLGAPSLAHPMGTDDVGRDVFARFLAGARISIAVGLGVALCAGVIGAGLGVVGGLSSGWVDTALARLLDMLLAFPPLILAMAITVGLGVGLITACIGIVLSTIPYYARITRSDVLRVRSAGYVEAAVALGVPPRRVIRRHIVPHVVPTILVQAATTFSFAILSVAGLGFIGLGAQIPTPEWGTMVTEGSSLFISGEWWVSTFPGIGLLIATAAAAVAADRVRSLADPHATVRSTLA